MIRFHTKYSSYPSLLYTVYYLYLLPFCGNLPAVYVCVKKNKVKDIPNSVIHITFGHVLNQELKEEIVPNSVTHLTFGYSFNQEFKKGNIPNSMHMK